MERKEARCTLFEETSFEETIAPLPLEIQAASMGHPDHDFLYSMLRSSCNNSIKERNGTFSSL